MLRLISRAIQGFNTIAGYLSALGIIVCTVALSYEVIKRYFFNNPTEWSMEFSIFMLIGTTFLSAGFTQLKRGHVGIELLGEILPAKWNRVRTFFSDVFSVILCMFVAYYAWKFFYLVYEQGWVTESTWGPKLWIPYFCMALGMTALSLQFLIQISEEHIGPYFKGE